MADDLEVTPGWLPPRPPEGRAAPEPAVSAPPPNFTTARAEPLAPGSPLAVSGTVVGSISILLLVLSLGVGYALCGLLSMLALALGVHARRRMNKGIPGRPGQAKAAIVVGGVGVGLALVAAVVWTTLEANGVSPRDLQEWLERELERRRG